MKIILPLVLLLLTGCSSIREADIPQDTSKAPAAPQRTESLSIAPEARRLIAEARELWNDPWSECRDAPKALQLLDKAVAIDPLDANAWQLRSRALADMGYLDDAFDDASKSIRLSGSASSYATRALILQKQNHLQGADRDLDYAEKLDPDEPLIFVFRAAGLFLSQQNSKGCENLKKAKEKGLSGPWEKAFSEGLCAD